MNTTATATPIDNEAQHAKRAQAKMLNRIERLSLNCEMTKAQVGKLASDAFRSLLILPSDYNDVKRILADRSQFAEDALSELRSLVANR